MDVLDRTIAMCYTRYEGLVHFMQMRCKESYSHVHHNGLPKGARFIAGHQLIRERYIYVNINKKTWEDDLRGCVLDGWTLVNGWATVKQQRVINSRIRNT